MIVECDVVRFMTLAVIWNLARVAVARRFPAIAFMMMTELMLNKIVGVAAGPAPEFIGMMQVVLIRRSGSARLWGR
jgi:hypothetical protein